MTSAPHSFVRRLLCTAATACAVWALAEPAMAAGFPEKPITLVVPFASGGSIDAAIRVVQPRLSAELGQPVVIENLGGAGGQCPQGWLHAAGWIHQRCGAGACTQQKRTLRTQGLCAHRSYQLEFTTAGGAQGFAR